MVVPSYICSPAWDEIHLVWPDEPSTWCGLSLSDVEVQDAVAPDVEPLDVRRYCTECEGLADHLAPLENLTAPH